jgi:hypothetical protein
MLDFHGKAWRQLDLMIRVTVSLHMGVLRSQRQSVLLQSAEKEELYIAETILLGV